MIIYWKKIKIFVKNELMRYENVIKINMKLDDKLYKKINIYKNYEKSYRIKKSRFNKRNNNNNYNKCNYYKLILIKFKRTNRHDNNRKRDVDVIKKHHHERLSRISNDHKFNFHIKRHNESIDLMRNRRRNEKFVKSFTHTNDNKFENAKEIDV